MIRAKHALSDVEETQSTRVVIFDRREKSFSDPSHSLGMTDLGLALCALAPCARQISLGYGPDLDGQRSPVYSVSTQAQESLFGTMLLRGKTLVVNFPTNRITVR
jgi:hypothetical protein